MRVEKAETEKRRWLGVGIESKAAQVGSDNYSEGRRYCLYHKQTLTRFNGSQIPTLNKQSGATKLTFAFVGIPHCCPCIRTIKIERSTLFAVATRRVVFAFALQLPLLVLDAARCMSITFTAPTNREVAERVSAGAGGEQ